MSATRKLSRHEAAEFIEGLRRDISAARLRVTLDGKLGRATPPAVKKLAALPEPPVIEGADYEPREEAGAASSHLALAASVLARAAARGSSNLLPPGYTTEVPAEFALVRNPETRLWPGVRETGSEQGTIRH